MDLDLILDFESKKPKSEIMNKNTTSSTDAFTPMTIGYIEKPKQIEEQFVAFESKQSEIELPSTLPTPSVSVKRTSEDTFSPNDSSLTSTAPLTPLEEDFKYREDELNSMQDYDMMTRHTFNTINDTLPDTMNVNDILFELQRQTVHSMMDEIRNISDILAASQLDVYSNIDNNTSDLSLENLTIPNEI